jgi:hypothetical protein
MKIILVASPREAVELKETVKRDLLTPSRLNKVRKMVRLISKETPRLYLLEKAWFDEILHKREQFDSILRLSMEKGISPSSDIDEPYVPEKKNPVYGCLFWVAIVFGIIALAGLTE